MAAELVMAACSAPARSAITNMDLCHEVVTAM